ncbi:calcium binding protein p22 [Trichuris trichiura]|uniref:Calcium binding protein p22 n=1 Tax=Trichuris trichiura TaxID=36087 RepID=A0A077ZH62_TRITR|nr:calcium binding protein p22 [Trichuris trichiura]
MGANTSLLLQDEEISEIQKETGFSKKQIVRLYSRFTSLDKSSTGALGVEDFLRIPELAINPLRDMIVNAFFFESEDGERVNFRHFVQVLARFRPIKKNKPHPLNRPRDKLRFAFGMYDLNRDGFITKNELLSILNMMVGSHIHADQLDRIATRTIAESDMNGDGKISFDEFCHVSQLYTANRKV